MDGNVRTRRLRAQNARRELRHDGGRGAQGADGGALHLRWESERFNSQAS